MDSNYKDFLKNLVNDHGRAIVGRLLNQIDILSNDKSLTEDQKFKLLKSLNKELIYEELRDFRMAIIFYNEGREYKKLPIYHPKKD
jgi:hypothetical protein